MNNLIKNRNFWLVLALDIVLVMCAYVGAHLLRFEGRIPQPFLSALKVTLPLVMLVKISFFYWFNLYRGMWRYTSLIDFMNVVKAVAVSSVCLILLILFLYGFVGFSRSVYIMDFVLTLCLVAGVRVAIRLYLLRDTAFIHSFFRKQGRPAKRMLLIGAGAAGEQILRELIGNQHLRAAAVGLLDDNAEKVGKSIHGVPVLGTVDRIEESDVDFDEILITCPSATGAQMKRIVTACEGTGKLFKTMPSVGEVIGGRVTMKMVREVSVADLVGREEVRLEEAEIKKYLLGKRVLVTGAGGSIGSELVRQIARFRPGALALADVSEYNLYQVEMECREWFRGRAAFAGTEMSTGERGRVQPVPGEDGVPGASVGAKARAGEGVAAGAEMAVAVAETSAGAVVVDVAAYLVDLSELRPTQRMFSDFRPDVVFHAAAYKHVPLQELNPWETVYNNLLAMRNLIACATETGVDKFVLVSTDKAVRPTNVMGATKRVCEMMAAAACTPASEGEEQREEKSDEQRGMSEKKVDGVWCLVDGEKTAVGNGSQPFRRVDEQREGKSDEQRATSDLPLPPPEGDTSNEAVGRGPRARRFSPEGDNTPCTSSSVIPADAGIQENEKALDSGFRRNDNVVPGNDEILVALRPLDELGTGLAQGDTGVPQGDSGGEGDKKCHGEPAEPCTKFLSVRFGNVLGSSGSVIPLFQQQIARGGPVTVTHPEITRYFMSIPEAAQLILQAGAMGEGREIFILKMGEPVRIADLAREVIKFHGLEPDTDIEIVFTGLRPGEKLYEELITEGEGIVPTRHEKIMVLQANECGNSDILSAQLDELLRIADTFDIPAIKAKLHEIVPEYTPER